MQQTLESTSPIWSNPTWIGVWVLVGALGLVIGLLAAKRLLAVVDVAVGALDAGRGENPVLERTARAVIRNPGAPTLAGALAYVALGGAAIVLDWVDSLWTGGAAAAAIGMGLGAAIRTGLGLLRVQLAMRRRRLYRQVEREVLSRVTESDQRDLDVTRTQLRQRAQYLFEQNVAARFVLKQVELADAGIFANLEWQPSEGINVMLGRNGYGKSYFLRVVLGLLGYDNDRVQALVGRPDGGARMRLGLLRDGEPVEVRHDGLAFEASTGQIPVLAIPDSRFINRTRDTVAPAEDDYADLARYGTRHFLYDIPFDASIQTVLSEMCIEVIGGRGTDVDYPRSPQIDLVSEVIRELSGEEFAFRRIRAVGRGRFEILVETAASPGVPITFQKASQGTLSVVSIFALVYQFLAKLEQGTASEPDGVTGRTAIVFVDEVDAHLHPHWQRKIVPLLRRTFPHVQFVLTAHSPLVVAGCSYGEISVLRRRDDRLTLVEYQNDFVGASVSDIYTELFEVPERDEVFLEYYAQLPVVKDLKARLESERGSSGRDEGAIEHAEQRLAEIEKARAIERRSIEVEMLTRENEQLRRQLDASKRRSGG